ncbi:MAG: hypothetical protein HY673_10970 [Chloroflexi bacterium]|nr:hypothetical protein [Chloroflexota bacterium]
MNEDPVFRHIVGKSTLKEGIAIPREFEDWFESPESGAKRQVTLVYDKDRKVTAVLRRVNNKSRSVQLKYETVKSSPFREWLQLIFQASTAQTIGEVLEFHKISGDRFWLNPLPADVVDGTNLKVSKTLYHGGAQNIIPYVPIFEEVAEAINEVVFRVGKTQTYYNLRLRDEFVKRGWAKDQMVIEDLNLRCDFRKANVQVEAEFGNARSYYQDYLKFSIAFNQGLITLGGLIAPTADFANVLCEVGRKNAWEKGNRRDGTEPTYSGMMTYEKAEREFPHLRFMLNMPIVVVGIDYKK